MRDKARTLSIVLLLVLPAGTYSIERLPGVWSNWRGPTQNGASDETGYPASWSPKGENLIWKVPIGGRSAPVVHGDRVYLLNTAGEGETEQEQLLCLDANTGKTIWHQRWNMFGSDVPAHRIGWSSPTIDPTTDRIYVQGGGGMFLCFDTSGGLKWQRSLAEEFGAITTHGGRTVTPVVAGDLVITSGINGSWGTQARGSHRYIAFDKMTGDVVWMSQPGGAPYDTCYPTALLAEFGGKQLLIDGNADGGVYAMKLLTGEKVWGFQFSKRAINSSAITDGKWVFATHGQENYDTNVMGRIVALDPNGAGDITKSGEAWRADGHIVEFPSPTEHGNHLFAIDNGANLICLDKSTGKELWRQTLGTIQKASPVYVDGKIYVGTENGKFFILQPGDTGCKILDEEELSPIAAEEEILASVAVAGRRVFMTSIKNTYCIGSKSTTPLSKAKPAPPRAPRTASGPAAWVQVVPTELIVAPGKQVQFKARTFDAAGNFIREEQATWALAGLQGELSPSGSFTAGKAPQAGEVKATVGSVTGAARIRVMGPLPYSDDFESVPPKTVPSHWTGAAGKYEVRDVEGNKVLVKLSNEQSLLRRARAYIGPPNLSNYTIEADVFGVEKRRQIGDIGIYAQRYGLVLAGNAQKLWIESWQPEVKRTKTIPFEWKGNVWYRMKLRVDSTSGGKALVRGKVWPKGSPEPEAWTIQKEDSIPNTMGAPGFYAYAHNEIYYDNVKVTENPK
jgi:outer membrane protein assembly factor BamB